jgi:hypothetical protein
MWADAAIAAVREWADREAARIEQRFGIEVALLRFEMRQLRRRRRRLERELGIEGLILCHITRWRRENA